MTFKVRAYPSKNLTNENLTVAEMTSVAPTASPQGDSDLEPMFIDVPEDQKRPKVTFRETNDEHDTELPFDLGSVNRSLLPNEVQQRLAAIERNYEDDLMTETGFRRKIRSLLKPYFGLLRVEPGTASLSVDVKRDDVDMRENSHSHNRGDVGVVTKNHDSHVEHGILR